LKESKKKRVKNKIEIYKTPGNQTEIQVQFEEDTVWLSQKQMGQLFEKDTDTISLHLKNIYESGELQEIVTTEESSVVQKEGKRQVRRKIRFYNLDAIISVGYRVNSKRGVQFRQWATQRLKDYLVQGYAINEKRLAQKQQEVEYLKTGIRILGRAIEDAEDKANEEVYSIYYQGLALLDDYDHEKLDLTGRTVRKAILPGYDDYMKLIKNMHSEWHSDVFAKPKDDSFNSSINQIKQSFDGKDLYPSIEEKAANLLYFITKNHSFVDGNKRIAAACFVYFLEQNKVLVLDNGSPVVDNNTLAALTLFIANSKTEETETVKKLVISMLNRNKQ
jgi:prophage maintenance system killer protein